MSRYRLFETKQFSTDLAELPTTIKNRISKKIADYVYPQLIENPHSGLNIKKLKNYDPQTWRYRIGDFRIFYEIDDSEMIVSIISLDQRKDAY